MGGIIVTDEGGTHSWDFVGCDGNADSAAADRNTPVHFFPRQCQTQRHDNVRIIIRGIVGESTIVLNRISFFPQLFEQMLFVFKSGMIGGNSYFHMSGLSCSFKTNQKLCNIPFIGSLLGQHSFALQGQKIIPEEEEGQLKLTLPPRSLIVWKSRFH